MKFWRAWWKCWNLPDRFVFCTHLLIHIHNIYIHTLHTCIHTSIALHCIALHCIALHCIALHCYITYIHVVFCRFPWHDSPKKLFCTYQVPSLAAARLYWRLGGCLSLALLAGGWHSSWEFLWSLRARCPRCPRCPESIYWESLLRQDKNR